MISSELVDNLDMRKLKIYKKFTNMAIELIILSLLMISLIFVIWFYYISFIRSLYFSKVPYVWTFKRQLNIIKKINIPKNAKIVDLGCWDGKALRFFEKEFWTIGLGYDINGFAIFYGKILNKILKNNVKLIKDDFFGKKIDDYDYIYLYLFPTFMLKIEERIFSAKSQNTIIISTAFQFKNHSPFQVLDWKIYLYK